MNPCGQTLWKLQVYWHPKPANIRTLRSLVEHSNIPGRNTGMRESFTIIIISFIISSDSLWLCAKRSKWFMNFLGFLHDLAVKNVLKGSWNLFSLIVCCPFQEMPGQLGDPAVISGAKGTADVTVSRPRTLPLPPHLLYPDRKKMPSEEFGSKTR